MESVLSWTHTHIEINNNKHVYRQSQVRMPNGCGVEWAECSLIIGTGCRVQVFSLILDSSVGLSAGIQSAGDLVSETLMGSNPAFSRGRPLVSFRFEYRLPVSIEISNNKHVYMYVCIYNHSLRWCYIVMNVATTSGVIPTATLTTTTSLHHFLPLLDKILPPTTSSPPSTRLI